MPGINALLLGTLPYRSRLVHRAIPLMGLIGAPLLLASAAAVFFGAYDQVSSVSAIATLPIAASELSLGIWLVVKGFKPSSITANIPSPEAQPELSRAGNRPIPHALVQPPAGRARQRATAVTGTTHSWRCVAIPGLANVNTAEGHDDRSEEPDEEVGDKTAVDDLSFTVHSGIVTGFLGPSGAGMSMTMRMILGLDGPTGGTCSPGSLDWHVTKPGRHPLMPPGG